MSAVKPKLRPDAETQDCPGCYVLHLYCKYENPDHAFDEFPHEYNHELGSVCRSDARKAGWILHRDGTATCPKCAKALNPSTSDTE